MTEDSPDTLPPADRSVVRWLLVLAWVVPSVIYAAFVVFAPSDVLARFAWLSGLCDRLDLLATAKLAPVDLFAHARATSFPQVARGATAIAMVLWPWSVAGTLLVIVLAHARMRRSLAKQYSFKQGLGLIFVVPICAMFGAGFFALPGDPSFARGLTTDGRIGFLVISFLSLVLSAICTAAWPVIILALGRMPFHSPDPANRVI